MRHIAAPSSKSLSHRLLMGAALAPGSSMVRRVLMSQDIERTMAILTATGARFEAFQEPDGADSFLVMGMPTGGPQGAPLGSDSPLDCNVHESGTTCRLLMGILAAGRGRFRLHGAGRMHQRPVGELAATLRSLGVDIHFEEKPDCPPLVLSTNGFQGQEASIGLDESSQYLSGLLLAAPLAPQGLSLTLTGHKVVSWPYVSLTLQTLEDFGLRVDVSTREHPDAPWVMVPWRTLHEARPHCLRLRVAFGVYRTGAYTVEGDWSGASYLLAAGAVGRQPLCVSGLNAQSLQGDRALLDILQRMGARVDITTEGITVHPSALHGIKDLDMGHCPDLVPTVAALAAFARGSTTVVNVAHLRIKESDRIAAPAAELRKVGVRVDEHEDGLSVHGLGHPPVVPVGTLFHSHGDHRIAMSTALLGLHGADIALDDPTVVRKSFPHFWKLWEQVRA